MKVILSDGERFKKVSFAPSWITPDVLAYYINKDGTRELRLSYGTVGNSELWGVELADIENNELVLAQAYDNINGALAFIKQYMI